LSWFLSRWRSLRLPLALTLGAVTLLVACGGGGDSPSGVSEASPGSESATTDQPKILGEATESEVAEDIAAPGEPTESEVSEPTESEVFEPAESNEDIATPTEDPSAPTETGNLDGESAVIPIRSEPFVFSERCSLLSETEIEMAVGSPVRGGSPAPNSPRETYTCLWPSGGDVAGVDIDGAHVKLSLRTYVESDGTYPAGSKGAACARWLRLTTFMPLVEDPSADRLKDLVFEDLEILSDLFGVYAFGALSQFPGSPRWVVVGCPDIRSAGPNEASTVGPIVALEVFATARSSARVDEALLRAAAEELMPILLRRFVEQQSASAETGVPPDPDAPCSLLSTDEIEEVVGYPVVDGVGRCDWNDSMDWRSADTMGLSIFLSLLTYEDSESRCAEWPFGFTNAPAAVDIEDVSDLFGFEANATLLDVNGRRWSIAACPAPPQRFIEVDGSSTRLFVRIAVYDPSSTGVDEATLRVAAEELMPIVLDRLAE
jgi:hypothetical protein